MNLDNYGRQKKRAKYLEMVDREKWHQIGQLDFLFAKIMD